MKKLLTLILIITFFNCTDVKRKLTKIKYHTANTTIEEIEIDKCQYIIYKSTLGSSMCHKGNCVNH